MSSAPASIWSAISRRCSAASARSRIGFLVLLVQTLPGVYHNAIRVHFADFRRTAPEPT